MAYIKQEDILQATNGGLDIILSYYPQAEKSLQKRNERFKIREEKTPSAALKKLPDGNYVVTDFGDDQTPKNGINICMLEENISFKEALALLASRYGIGGIKAEINKPIFEAIPATAEQQEGTYSFEVNKEISEQELTVLGPKVTAEVCAKYNVNSLKSFTYIKDRRALITQATEHYPIFLFNDSNKIYMPLNPDKGYRFRYVGKKEKDFVNGLKQLKEAYIKHREMQLSADDDEKTIEKLSEAILCSGERDALNIAGHGYMPVWLNSETAKLTGKNFKDIIYCVETLYNLPDIDTTGIKAAIRLGMQYLDIKIIILPPELATFRDARGKPRKDLLDYVELYPQKKDFKKLIDVAKPLRFWDVSYNKEKTQLKYKFNSAHALFFLWANGFGKLEDKNTNEGSIIIQVEGNVVKEINPRDVKSFFLDFREKRYLSVELENLIIETPALNDDRLRTLKKREIDFSDFDSKSQYLFFENGSVKVTKDGIFQFKPGELNRYTWEEKVIPHKFKKLNEMFKIEKMEGTEFYDIEVLNHKSHFFNYLTNASRIHWQNELENKLDLLPKAEQEEYKKKYKFSVSGSLLTPEEIAEQKQHLVNKIFSIGYLLHQYKNSARPWAIYAVDNKLAGNDESCGGSGKSFCYSALNIFKKSVTLAGRDAQLTENKHIYDRVNDYTDFVLVDDCARYLKFNFFFDVLTGVMNINPKNNKSYEIPFIKSPKFCFTSNYMLNNPDPSTLRRILFTVFSDYYHEKTEYSSYRETRKIADDFDKQLFSDYNEEEWNNDLNFFAQCLQFYLSIPSPQKIEPPMGNVILRNLLAEMGDAFKDWADVFFADNGDNVDKIVAREDALNDFIRKTNSQRWTTSKFTKALKAYCRYNGYNLNPSDLTNSKGRIIRKNKEQKSTEMIYVQVKEKVNPIYLTKGSQIAEEDKPF